MSAILSADVVGFTQLVREDEVGTIEALKRIRSALIDPTIAEFQGRIVKLMGDGTLVEFASVVDAVECAAKIQTELSKDFQNNPGDAKIRFRIGITLGDVVLEGDDIYGDGVNLASRLEALAEPGGICISAIVKESIGSKTSLNFKSEGSVPLKGVSEPVSVWSWSPNLSASGSVEVRSSVNMSEKPVIAVLAFDNLSENKQDKYFCEGVSEDIITELSKFHSIGVLARHSSFAFSDKQLTAPEISARLGAHYLVEGSVRRSGSRLRIVAQLIEGASGKHVWADCYNEDESKLIEVEDRIVSEVAGKVESSLLREHFSRRVRGRTWKAGPYDLWLQARKLMETWSQQDDRNAEKLLQEAVAIDPLFARAHGALAGIYNTRVLLLPGTPEFSDLLKAGLKSASRAVDLDPDDGRNHVDLAWSYMLLGQHSRGEKHFSLAMKMNPNDASILAAVGLGFAFLGRPADGESLVKRAMELNPIHPDYYMANLAFIQFIAGDYGSALSTIDCVPQAMPELQGWRAATLAQLGRSEEARQACENFRKMTGEIWQGSEPMTDGALLQWMLSINAFSRPEDLNRLREGLTAAGLDV